MDYRFEQSVMLERIDLIARLTTTGECGDKDREIALVMIAELVLVLMKKEAAPSPVLPVVAVMTN